MNSILIITTVLVGLTGIIQLASANKAAIFSVKNLDNHWTAFKKEHVKKYDNSTHELQK
jgi:hypothetical protein